MIEWYSTAVFYITRNVVDLIPSILQSIIIALIAFYWSGLFSETGQTLAILINFYERIYCNSKCGVFYINSNAFKCDDSTRVRNFFLYCEYAFKQFRHKIALLATNFARFKFHFLFEICLHFNNSCNIRIGSMSVHTIIQTIEQLLYKR